MPRLLTYEWQHANCSESGRGWDWDTIFKMCDNEGELQEAIQDLQQEISQAFAFWEAKDPKWRDPKFIPPYRKIKIFDMTLVGEVSLDQTLAKFEESRAADRILREKLAAEEAVKVEERERALLETLQAKYQVIHDR